MKSLSIIRALVVVFLLCLNPTAQADPGNLITTIPDWNQPADYFDSFGTPIVSYPEWCGPTAGASIMGFWEDNPVIYNGNQVGLRAGIADGMVFPNSPAFPAATPGSPGTPGTWQQGLWHDGTIEMGWFMNTQTWRTNMPLSFPPGPPSFGGGGTDPEKVGSALVSYAAAYWKDNEYPPGNLSPGTNIVKKGYPNTIAFSDYSGQNMWANYKAEINAGRPVEVAFRHWVDLLQQGANMFIDPVDPLHLHPVETYQWDNTTDGHLVVGVGYIENALGNWFVCQDNWANTGQLVAVQETDPTDILNPECWQANIYLWGLNYRPEYTWTGQNNFMPTKWGKSSNWIVVNVVGPAGTLFNVPNSAGAHITFPNKLADYDVDLMDEDCTVGTITYDPSFTHTTILSTGGTTLTLDNLDDNGNPISAEVTVNGHHLILADVALNSNVNITTINMGCSLDIEGHVTDGAKGAKGITLKGGGILLLNGLNSYTGVTDIQAGILYINSVDNAGAPSSIGEASADPANFILHDGTKLYYIGATCGSGDRGLTMYDNLEINAAHDLAFNGSAIFSTAAAATHLNTSGAGTFALGGQVTANMHFYKTGAGTLQYSAPSGIVSTIASGASDMSYLIQNGSVIIQGADNTTQYNVTNGELVVGDTTTNAVNLTINSGRLNVGTYLSIGHGNGTTGLSSTLIANGGIITTQHVNMGYDAGVVGFNAAPGLTLKNSAQLNSSSFCYLGESPGSHASITLQNDSQFYLSDWVSLGLFGNGTMTVKNSAKFIQLGGACDFNIGDFGTGNLTIQDTATVSAGIMYVGRRQNSNGVISQTGGAVDFNKTYNGINFIGGADPSFQGEANPTNAWGAYNLSGISSTLSFVGSLHIGNYGIGAFNQIGGTVSTSGWWLIGHHVGSYGVYNIDSGSLTLTNTNACLAAGDFGTGTLNISGTGSVDVAGFVGIGLNDPSSVGVVNLNGGTLAATDVRCVTPAATAFLNFHGGELKANTGAGNADFVSGLDGAYVWNGGAVINTNGNDVTLNAVLKNPTGKGLQDIAVTNGGSGYMGTPVVNITTNGSGKGATAVAYVSDGVVTGITITNPGVDYATGDTITVQLLGGGAATAATLGTVTLNDGNNSTGGLRKKGLGKLTLLADNIYIGTTYIDNGTLQLGNNGTIGSVLGPITINNASLIFDRFDDYVFVAGIQGTALLVSHIGDGKLTLQDNANYAGSTAFGSGGGLVIKNTNFQSSITIDNTVKSSNTLELNYDTDGWFVNGAISGNGVVRKTGAGQAILTANNSAYTGPVNIEAGQIQIRNSSALGNTSNLVTVSAGGVLNSATNGSTNSYTVGNNVTLNGASGGLDGGYLSVQNADTAYTGTITAAGVGVQLGHISSSQYNGKLFIDGDLVGANSLNLTSGGSGDPNTYSGAVQLRGSSTKSFSGPINLVRERLELNVTGANAFNSTDVTIGSDTGSSRGVLMLMQNNQIPDTAAITFKNTSGNYGYFRLNGNSETVASISDLTGRAFIENTDSGHFYDSPPSPASTLTLAGNADYTYAGRIRDNNTGNSPLTLVKNGISTFALTGSATNSGGIQVNGGKLQIGDSTSGGVLSSPVTLNNSTSVVFDNSSAAIATCSISGATGSIVQRGAGATRVSGHNSYGGGTFIENGKLVATQPASLKGDVTFNGNGTLSVGSDANALGSVVGFGGNGTGWTLNKRDSSSVPPPTIINDVLTLTTADASEARSAIYNQRVSIKGFEVHFTYTPMETTTSEPADGITFVLQNDLRGVRALGSTGGKLGYGGEDHAILPSFAMELNIYESSGRGTAWAFNGGTGGYIPQDMPWWVYSPNNPTPLDITIGYLANDTIFFQITDGVHSEGYYMAYQNLRGLLGDTAYLGFTGATGAKNVRQTISNFSYTADASFSTVYTNNLVVAAGITGNVKVSYPSVTMGNLSLAAGGGLNVSAENDLPTDNIYNLTLGSAALAGSGSISVAKNGTGMGTLTLTDALSGTGGTLTKTDAGILSITGGINPGALTLLDIQDGAVELNTTGVSDSNLDVQTALSGKLLITNQSHILGDISGTGTTEVISGQLTASSIVQGTLTIGASSTGTIAPNPGGSLAELGPVSSVPEPSIFVLLSAGVSALTAYAWLRRRRTA
ncbi:MAG: autotransporter-associated beta strand repeat-containing protein [Thermoguttaceae bacterium]